MKFARLIVRIDQELFGPYMFSELRKEAIALPTDSEVQAEIEAAGTTANEVDNTDAVGAFE
jgi:hypothetical protein